MKYLILLLALVMIVGCANNSKAEDNITELNTYDDLIIRFDEPEPSYTYMTVDRDATKIIIYLKYRKLGKIREKQGRIVIELIDVTKKNKG